MNQVSDVGSTPKGTSIRSATTGSTGGASKGAAGTGKDDFMKLLLAQLQHQDPLKPMEDQQFIAQVAQFNSLEEMTNMNKTLAAVLLSQQIGEASGLIGKAINAIGSDGKAVSGVVTAASVEKGAAVVHLGDTKVAIDKITAVAPDEGSLPIVRGDVPTGTGGTGARRA